MNASSTTSFLSALVLLLNVQAEEPEIPPGRMVGGDYDLKEEFDPAELRHFAEMEQRDFDANRRLWMLIVRAGLEKDRSIRKLLSNKELRASDTSVDLALSAYDYMINQDETALDHILAFLATERVGEDTNTIIILSAINEWDRTIKAFKKHFYVVDGAGGANYRGFMAVRRYLYPDLYSKHQAAVEASPRQ